MQRKKCKFFSESKSHFPGRFLPAHKALKTRNDPDRLQSAYPAFSGGCMRCRWRKKTALGSFALGR